MSVEVEGRGWKQGECGGGGDGNRVSVEGRGWKQGECGGGGEGMETG